MITFTVAGLPAPQGSKRHVGHGRMVESSKALAPWREAVKWAAVDAKLRNGAYFHEPIVASMVFAFDRPKSHFGTGRNAGIVKASAPRYPGGKPDLSKLIRSTEDALKDAGLIADDALIVRYALAAKTWTTDAVRFDRRLATPGAWIGLALADDSDTPAEAGYIPGGSTHVSEYIELVIAERNTARSEVDELRAEVERLKGVLRTEAGAPVAVLAADDPDAERAEAWMERP